VTRTRNEARGRLPAAICLALSVLLAIHVVAPQPGGPLALTQIAEPLLVLPGLLLAPLAVRHPVGRFAALAIVLFAIGRYVPGLVSFPSQSAEPDLRVASWNLRGNATPPDALVEDLAATTADLVALQELSREQAAAIEADPRLEMRFPHRVLKPDGRLEMGLLSAFEIVSKETSGDPKTIELVIDRGPLGRMAVIDVHPLPRGIVTLGPIPVAFEAHLRDLELAALRARVDRLATAGLPVVLLGDMNVTEREPAYRDLARGLIDAQLEVGTGWGATWRPAAVRQLPFGVLRIDYVLSTPDLLPVAFDTDCAPRGGDHCRLSASLVARPG
jgi:vancomycin resistance protein VanJ